MKREVSQLLLSGIKDDRVGMGMVSVTHVDVAGDLQHAKIFVSVYGSAEARSETMAGLKSATGFVRGELGRRMRLRRTPEIIFLEDLSIEQGTQVLSLINRLSQERQASGWDDELDREPGDSTARGAAADVDDADAADAAAEMDEVDEVDEMDEIDETDEPGN
jgi:ribosome-binding factor A